MAGKKEKAKEDKTLRMPARHKDLFGRRQFISGAIALGIGSTGMTAGGSKRSVAKAKIPAEPAGQAPRIAGTSRHNGLNMIVIIADTWRADHLCCYGGTRIKTPNLDKLASEGVLFSDVTTEALPTIPARRVYHTGKSVLGDAKKGMWRPLSRDDVTFAEVLSKHHFTTGFIVDTYHYFKEGYNFHRFFDSWQWIRGQETDKWRSGPKERFDPKRHMPSHLWNENYDKSMRQYLMNTQDRKGEQDYFCAQSCRAATCWLEQNINNKPFMLWLDMFDPHEPWDAPPRFQQMYRDKYPFERYIFGYGVKNKHNCGDKQDIRPEDVPVLRDLYAAEVTFSDYCIGRLLDAVEQMGLKDDTVIVFSTDHGTHLGEQGYVQKSPELLNGCVSHIPLIIRHPDKSFAGKGVDGIVSAVDFMPTFLALLGISDYKDMDGQDMWKLATGELPSIHDDVYTVFEKFGAVHNLDWHYFQHIIGKKPGEGPCLYDLKNDKNQTKNVIKQFPRVAKALRNKLQNHLRMEIPALKLST